jgi:hypothetical protein
VDSNGHDTVTRSDGVALSFDHLRSNVATGRIDASTQSEGDADVDCFGGNMRDLNNGGKNKNFDSKEDVEGVLDDVARDRRNAQGVYVLCASVCVCMYVS